MDVNKPLRISVHFACVIGYTMSHGVDFPKHGFVNISMCFVVAFKSYQLTARFRNFFSLYIFTDRSIDSVVKPENRKWT